MIKSNYDIIIVGAGPAGATAALYAKKHNLNCLVIEKSSFPKDKICGDAFMPVCETILNELDLSLNFIDKKDICFVDAVNFFSNNEKFQVPALVYNCKRVIFDNFIFEKANSQVQILQNATILSLLKKDNEVTGLSVEWNNEIYKITSKYIIGADGATSKVRRLIGVAKMSDCAIACRSYLSYNNTLPLFSIKYLTEITPGYFWMFRVSDSEVNVGTILFNENHKSTLIETHKKYVLNFLNTQLESKEIYSWQLPFTNNTNELCLPGCLLIGDAAGLIDPLIGHGIDTAMISAKFAIESIVEGKTTNNVCELYRRKIEEKILSVGSRNRVLKYKLQELQNTSDSLLLDKYLNHLNNGYLSYGV